MKPDWRRTAAARAIIRGGGRDMMAGTLAGLGGAIAIATMEWFSTTAHYPLAVIPFATSIVLVIGAPEAEPAQPRALVGGHLVATLVGFAVLWVTGPQAWAAALAVGLSILAMYLTGTSHPPTGINRCWPSPTTCRARSCSRRCWPACCCWPPSPMPGTAGSATGRGRGICHRSARAVTRLPCWPWPPAA
jgi:hypothetical protein